MTYITAIATASPTNKIEQTRIADFMMRSMQLDKAEARKLLAIFKGSGIDTRYSVLSDYATKDSFTFYSNAIDMLPFPTTRERNNAFRKYAPALSSEAAQKAMTQVKMNGKDITHLITVSCTGMYAPGLDIELVEILQLNAHVSRTNINFMGCYAAFNALKVAEAFCKAEAMAKVLIVCTELCSLHFQKENSEDNMLANALFGDGAAAVIVEGKPAGRALKIAAHHSELAREGNNDMAWSIGDTGFEMMLSSYVPQIIQGGIKKLTATLLSKLSLCVENIQHMAIHPGGKRILEAIEKELGLTKTQNQWAYHVLRQYGNMSSPTVLFVLKEIFDRLEKRHESEHVLSFAFGPGLTLESMLFTYHHD